MPMSFFDIFGGGGGGGMPQQPMAQQQQPGPGGLAGLLGDRRNQMALLGAGAGMIDAGAPSRTPTTMGDALGGALQGGLSGHAIAKLQADQEAWNEQMRTLWDEVLGQKGGNGVGGGTSLAGALGGAGMDAGGTSLPGALGDPYTQRRQFGSANRAVGGLGGDPYLRRRENGGVMGLSRG